MNQKCKWKSNISLLKENMIKYNECMVQNFVLQKQHFEYKRTKNHVS